MSSNSVHPCIVNTLKLALLFIFAVCTSNFAAAGEDKHVLILHSYHKGLGWTDSINYGIEETLAQRPSSVILHYEYMDTKRVFDPQHLENLVTFYSHKYRNTDFDGIISTDDHAFQFLLANGQSLFPGTPVVFCGVNGFSPELIENRPMFTGVIEALSIPETLEAAYTMNPDIKRVYAVVDDTVTGRSNKKQLQNAIERFQKRVQAIYLEQKTMAEMIDITSNLPENSILMYLSFTTDAAGQKFSLEEGAARINQSANRPMYSFWDFHLGHGVIGGRMTHGFTQGETAANIVKRILMGESPEAIPVLKKSPNQYIFDYTIMEKFHLDKAKLPQGSTLLNRPKTFLEENRELLLQFLAIIVVLVIIITLLGYNFIKLRIADNSLKASEERFRELTEMLPEAIYEIDKERQITFLNESGLESFGLTERDLHNGLSYYELFAPREKSTLDKRFNMLDQGKTPGLQEYHGIRRNGEEFPVIARSMPIFKGNEVIGTRGILIDISEKKQLEDQIRNAQRMESIGTLAGGIAHDFNNLLMGIQGRASLALVQTDPESKIHGHLNGIDQCVRSAANLTQQLLGFARAGKYELKHTDINKLIQQTSEMFGRTRKQLQIRHKLQPSIWTVSVDRSQIEQVLLNLFINAWQAMEETGLITISSENFELTEAEAVSPGMEKGRYVRIVVTDTGSGIHPDIKAKIFDPFFTTKERGRGTGLGLASAYGIINNHNGSIDVTSTPGEGASFTFFLPALQAEVNEEHSEKLLVAGGEETLLLVDDEDLVRDVTAGMLEELGYTVHTAHSGTEAIRLVTTLKDDINMVLLDMIMPDISGEETFRELRKISPKIKVLLSSGYSAEEKSLSLIDEGSCSFIQKPFDLQTLSGKVRELLR